MPRHPTPCVRLARLKRGRSARGPIARRVRTGLLSLVSLASLSGVSAAQEAQVVNLLEFRTGDPVAFDKIRRNSSSLPLTLEELTRLSDAGVGEASLLELIRTRRVLLRADAEVLLALKAKGLGDALLTAVSTHAWPPNEGFDLNIQTNLASPRDLALAPYLYVEIFNPGLKRQEAFLHADLRRAWQGNLTGQTVVDRSDPLLPETVRTVDLAARVRTRQAGKLEVRVLVTQAAGLRDLSNLGAPLAAQVRTFALDYPAVSLDQWCRLQLDVLRDTALRDRFNLRHGHLECRWN